MIFTNCIFAISVYIFIQILPTCTNERDWTHTSRILIQIIFYRVFASRIQTNKQKYKICSASDFSKKILQSCYHFDRYKLLSWNQFCTTVNLNEKLSIIYNFVKKYRNNLLHLVRYVLKCKASILNSFFFFERFLTSSFSKKKSVGFFKKKL